MTKLFEDDDLEDKKEIEISEDDPLKPFLEKYKDPMGVAKKIVEADRFIKQLSAENAELRTEVSSRGRVEEVVDRLLSAKKPEAQNDGGNQSADEKGNEGNSSKSGLTEEDVRAILEKERSKLIAETNVEKTKTLLKEKFGGEYAKVLVARAKELGESAEFFDALARKNPAAVLALVANQQAEVKKQEPSLFNTGSVNTTSQAMNRDNGSVRNQEYYNSLKKKVGLAEFMKPAIQNQLHKDALAQGPSFFN